MNSRNQNVLIAGAGPVGLALAADLARFGVSVRLIDKAPQRTDKSKALVLWSRTLELMDRMGCTAPFVTAGRKASTVNVAAGKEQIAKIKVDGVTTPHPYALMIPQCDTERLMGDFVASLGVEIERDTELVDFVATADGITATLRQPGAADKTFESGWLIGCDGAHSTVRHTLGLEFAGTTMPSSWVIADVLLSNVPDAEDILISWHADGVLAVFPIAVPRYRVIADAGLLNTGAAPASPTLAEVQTILDVRGPGGITVSNPIWLTGFSINERKVANYRSGRVFVMGDAAHIHSPAGGQGMNTGMQDAFNLAWKLAWVTQGIADEETLLNSYSAERSPIAAAVLEGAGKMTEVSLMKGDLKQAIRNHLAAFLLGFSPVKRKVADALTELSISYPNSPLNGKGGYGGGGPKEGERAPVDETSPRVGAGNTPRFALFANADGATASALLEKFSNFLEPVLRDPFQADGMWLVRPDGYVALATRQGHWTAIEQYLQTLNSNQRLHNGAHS